MHPAMPFIRARLSYLAYISRNVLSYCHEYVTISAKTKSRLANLYDSIILRLLLASPRLIDATLSGKVRCNRCSLSRFFLHPRLRSVQTQETDISRGGYRAEKECGCVISLARAV